MATCIICGCSDDRPCFGGVIFTSAFDAAHVYRLVADEEVLAPGETCAWLDPAVVAGADVCDAHTVDEFADHGLIPLEELRAVGGR